MSEQPHPADDRDESVDERLDRNFDELLQELRVLQTGTQILAGFLLTVPFQAGFTAMTDYQRDLFLVALGLAFLTTVLLVGPVSLHRALFREHRKARIVRASHLMARMGLATLGLTMTASISLIFNVVAGHAAGLVTAAVSAALFLALWWWLPRLLREHDAQHGERQTP